VSSAPGGDGAAPPGSAGEAEAGEGGVGGELDEIVGMDGAQLGLVRGQGGGDRLDLAEHRPAGLPEELIDAAGERERPTPVHDLPGDGDFERGGLRMIPGGLPAELLVPVGAELRAPEAGGAGAAGIVGAEGEGGKFADAQAGGAGVEGEFHAVGSLTCKIHTGIKPRHESQARSPDSEVTEQGSVFGSVNSGAELRALGDKK
jgi:hypothetical protein